MQKMIRNWGVGAPQVKVNIYFVFKAALNKHPGEVITGIMLAMYVVSVWCLRTCELYYTLAAERAAYSDSRLIDWGLASEAERVRLPLCNDFPT